MDAASVDIQRLWRGHQGRKESARQQLIYERTRLKLRKEKSNKAVNNSNSYSNNHSNSGRSSVVDSDSNRNVSGVVEEIGDERVTVFKAVKKKKSGAVSSPSRPFIPVLVPSTAVHDDQSLLQIPHRLNNNNSNSSSNSDGNSDGNNNSYSNNSMENNIRAIMYDNDYEDNRGQLNVIEEEEDEMLRDSLNTTAIKKQISRPHSCFSKSKHSDSHLTDSRNKSTGALSHSHRDSHEIPQNYSSPEDLVTPGNNTDVDEDFYNSDRNKNYSREYDRPNLVELGDMYDDVAAVVDSLDDPLEQFRREDYGQYVSTDEDDFAEMEKKILSENNDHLRTNTKGNASSTVGGRISNNSSHLKRSNSYTYNNNDKVDDLVDERFDELANKLLQSLPRSNLISSRKGSTDLIKYGSVTHSEDSLTDLQGANDCTEQIVEQSALNKKRIDHSNEEEKGFVPVTTNENHRQVKKQQIISPRAVVSNSNINSISPRVGVPQTSAGLQPSSGSSYLEINAKQKQKEQSLLENAKKLYDQNAKRNFPLLKQAQMQAK